MAESICKVCKKTGDEVEFYDSIATHCKEHWKKRVRENRVAKKDYYQEYERKRSHLPHRVKSRNYSGNGNIGLYCVIPKTHKARGDYTDAMAYYYRNPDKLLKKTTNYRKNLKLVGAAHGAVSRAIKAGALSRGICELCGESHGVEAHHDDYLEPLNVRWLCNSHHKQWHRSHGHGLNRR